MEERNKEKEGRKEEEERRGEDRKGQRKANIKEQREYPYRMKTMPLHMEKRRYECVSCMDLSQVVLCLAPKRRGNMRKTCLHLYAPPP